MKRTLAENGTIMDCIRSSAMDIKLVREADEAAKSMGECEYITKAEVAT